MQHLSAIVPHREPLLMQNSSNKLDQEDRGFEANSV